MRYNSTELRYMGTLATKCSKEGIMFVKEKEGKFWNKNEVMAQRWFRLAGNLLFYLKTNFKNSEPIGVYILEQCRARPCEENTALGIVLEFKGDSQIVNFRCTNESDAQDWIYKINRASYNMLKNKYLQLLSTIQKLKRGSSQAQSNGNTLVSLSLSHPAQNNMSHTTTTYNDQSISRIVQINSNDSSQLQPVLELSLSGVNLQIDEVHHPSAKMWIKLEKASSSSKFYRFHSLTETVPMSRNPHFLTILSFYGSDNLNNDTSLQFSLFYKKSGTVHLLGVCTCRLIDLITVKQNFSILPLRKGVTFYGGVRVTVCRQKLLDVDGHSTQSSSSQKLTNNTYSNSDLPTSSSENTLFNNRNFEALYNSAISRVYRFPVESANNTVLKVQEVMLETRLSFHIPIQYLNLCIDEDNRCIGELESIGKLNAVEEQKIKKIIESRKQMITMYHEHVRHLQNNNKAPYFKPSVQKAEREMDFVPINLHLQRMCVYESDTDEIVSDYNVITTGASSAHSLGFKSGGLLTLLQTQLDGTRKKSHMLHCLLQSTSKNKFFKASHGVKCAKTNVTKIVDKLKSLLPLLDESNVTIMQDEITALAEAIAKYERLMSQETATQALESLFLAKQEQPANASIPGFLQRWEEEKVKMKLKFSEIVRHVDLLMNNASGNSIIERDKMQIDMCLTSANQAMSDFVQLVEKIYEHTRNALTYLNFKSNEINFATLHRRDIAFSHSLSICACGVSTAIYSNINNKNFFKQILLSGVLLQIESLISTYGNENAMLEDYIVGINDLNNVTIQCVQSSGTEIGELLPTLHGTREAVTIKLHLDTETFNKLPDGVANKLIKVRPVFFNIGVNEEQTMADKFGSTSLQDYINIDSMQKLQKYYDEVKEYVPDTLSLLLFKLQKQVHTKKNKNVEILQLANEICREMSGVRITSCKSAKDRTAMAVTLEQTQLLSKYHNLHDKSFQKVLDCMRCEGTRRENTHKNTGSRKYAFTYFQLMTFPQQYRPPDGTYGSGQT